MVAVEKSDTTGNEHGHDAPATVENRDPNLVIGCVIIAVTTAAAYGLHYLPVYPFTIPSNGGATHPVSAAMLAIIIGAILKNTMRMPSGVSVVARLLIKKGIPLAIVLAGASLNLYSVMDVGVEAIIIIVLAIAVGVGGGYLSGRLLRLSKRASLLLGFGTGICGNAAIAAAAPLIEADDDDMVLSIAAVNLFGLLTLLCWPVFGQWLSLSNDAYGIWSGVSIHAVPQAVAAGYAMNEAAGTIATLVKMVRVTMLAPLLFLLAIGLMKSGRSKLAGGEQISYRRFFPLFIWGFLAAALLKTFGMYPNIQAGGPGLDHYLSKIGGVLLTVCLAGIGLEIRIRSMLSAGRNVLIAGLLSTFLLGVTTLVAIKSLIGK